MCVNGELIGTHGHWTGYQMSTSRRLRPPKPRGRDHRLSTACGVVERPDHQCGDDLVPHKLGIYRPNPHKMAKFHWLWLHV